MPASSKTTFAVILLLTILCTTILGYADHNSRAAPLAGQARVIKSIPIPPVIGDITWDGENLWALSRSPPSVLKINPENGAFLDNITVPVQFPYGLAWDGTALWVGDDADEQFYRINATTGAILHQLNGTKYVEQAGTGRIAQFGGITCNGTHLWLTVRVEANIYCIDIAGDTLVKITPSIGIFPISIDVKEGYLWVCDPTMRRVDKIHPNGGPSLYHFLGPASFPEGIAWRNNTMWIVDNSILAISEVDPFDTAGYAPPPPTPIYFGLPLWAWFIILFFSLPIIFSTYINWRSRRKRDEEAVAEELEKSKETS